MSYYNINITPEMRGMAFEQAIGLKHFHKNFKRKMGEYENGELTAKIEGVLGELVVEAWLVENKLSFTDNRKNPEFDYLIEGCAKIEVKAKTRSVYPQSNYEATVPKYVHEFQKPGFYLFVSHKTDPKIKKGKIERYINSYIVGGIDRKTFDLHKRLLIKGDYDPSNKWNCKESCYNLNISQLIPINEFLIRLERWLLLKKEQQQNLKIQNKTELKLL